MLVSGSLLTATDMDILTATYTSFGNDGNHFDIAINEGMNNAVPDSVADALHEASDHLPVFADFVLKGTSVKEENEQPKNFKLSQNYPNPFNPTTTISYSLSKTSEVSLKIYNLAGQHIRILVDGKQSSGQNYVVWDGRDRYGFRVAAGIYIYELRTGEEAQARKMVLLP